MPPEDNKPVVNPTLNNPDNPVNLTPNAPNVPANQPANAVVNATPSPGTNQVGVFTTPQSLITFSGATAAVTTIWQVLGVVNPAYGHSNKYVPFVLALVIGAIIYIGTVSRGLGIRQKIIEAGVAIINSFTIAAAAFGIGTATPAATPNTANPNPAPVAKPNANSTGSYKKPLSDGREVSIVYRENEQPKLLIS